MSLLVLKVILTPLLVAAATLAARRWGFMVGGWLAGLPLVSGPISIFLALEQGPAFAAQAAAAALLGLFAAVTFCLVYACGAKKLTWQTSLLCAFSVYLLTTWGLSLVTSSLVISSVSVILLVGAAMRTIGVSAASPFQVSTLRADSKQQSHAKTRREERNTVLHFVFFASSRLRVKKYQLVCFQVAAPPWDLPVRMATATAIVLLITGGAEYLGPKWSGLLSPFPVFACIMAVFSQIQGGAVAVRRLLRGMIMGCLGAASFLVVVGFAVERTSLILVYALATGIAVIVNGASFITLIGLPSQSTRT